MPSEQEQSYLSDDHAFVAAAVDFSDAGPERFKPGYEQYRDLALAAQRLADLPNQMDGDKALAWMRTLHGKPVSLAFEGLHVPEDMKARGHGVIPLYAHPPATPAPDKALMPEAAVGEYPLSARVWKRSPYGDCPDGEWVLEITGSVNGTHLTCRHTEPLTTAPEDVPGLPSLYATPVEEPANAATGAKRGDEPTDEQTAEQARRALGIWMAWPDAPRDGPVAVSNSQVCSWLQGVPSVLARNAATNAGQVEALHGCVGIQSNGGNGSNPFVKIYFTEPGQEVRFHEFLTAALTNGQATGESK